MRTHISRLDIENSEKEEMLESLGKKGREEDEA
jgi:hypothetical protein